jgi:hypothetical protein
MFTIDRLGDSSEVGKMEISQRSVYLYIVGHGGSVKVVGKNYAHTKIASGMGSPFEELAVLVVLESLGARGVVELKRRLVQIIEPIDPNELDSSPVHLHLGDDNPEDDVPDSLFTGTSEHGDTQASLAAVPEFQAPITAGATPMNMPPSAGRPQPRRQDYVSQTGSARRGLALDRLKADNARLMREVEALTQRLADSQTSASVIRTYTPPALIQMINLLMAALYQQRYEAQEITSASVESERSLAEAHTDIHALERRLAQAESTNSHRETEIARIRAENEKLTQANRELSVYRDRTKAAMITLTDDLMKMADQRDDALDDLERFTANRIMVHQPLHSCHHEVTIMVDPEHKPALNWRCRPLRIYEKP